MLWFAISIQGEIEKYGAYVGVAAFFGLAVLSLLYFAQARELKRLRDWAGRAPERAQEIEARVVATADEVRRAQAAERSGTVGPARPVEQPAAPVAQPSGNGRPATAPAAIPVGPRPAVAVAAAAARAQATVVAAPAPAETDDAEETAPAPQTDGGRPPEETQLHDTLGAEEEPAAEP